MSDKIPFEIPGPMRELAEQNVKQAQQAYSQFMDMARKAQEMLVQSQGTMTENAMQVQGKAMRYAQDNLDASFSFASDLARARDLKEAMEIQQRFAERQMRNYTEQAQELGKLMADTAQKMKPRT
ncbi:MAG: phasin family protein [Hyphomicrobiaceae bacterium]